MGISASTMSTKKDGTGEVSDKLETLPSPQSLNNDNKAAFTNLSSSDNVTSHIEIHDLQAENYNNNNNLDSLILNINNNAINLVLTKECETKPVKKVSKMTGSTGKGVEVSNQYIDRDKRRIHRGDQKPIEPVGNRPRSKLPIKATPSKSLISNQVSSTRALVTKNKLPSKCEIQTKLDNTSNTEVKSKIPVKNINRLNPPMQKRCIPKQKQTNTEKEAVKPAPSKLPVKVRSPPNSTPAAKTKKCEFSEVCKHSIEYFKGISGETIKLADRLSDEEKKMQTEISDDEDSTSRNTSLSEVTQVSQPSVTSRSAKDMKVDAASLKSKIEKTDSERRSSRRTGPQSPCERTDIRMAIVADHLGLSWTELARELNFSVDEINQIRVENPNSLTTQSFMLLKKWVVRDGKNATTDALTNILTKINRIDIVTLLEGPIFDYGNISGTRSFADDNNLFHDSAVDGWHSEASSINVEPPTPDRKMSSELMERLDDSHESITSYLKGEVGRLESSVSPSESITEGKTRSTIPEADIKLNERQNIKPKTLQGTNGKGEQTSPTVHQKSMEATSKTVIGEHRSSLPISAKRAGPEEGKCRSSIHVEEGSSSEQKTEGHKVKTKKEVRHIEKKSYS